MQAAEDVLKEIGFQNFSVDEAPGKTGERVDMLAALGLVGDLKGHLVVRMGSKTAKAFVAQLSSHLGMDGDPEDLAYRKGALGEIANQMGGRAIVLLSGKGIEAMITPPTVITGEGVDSMLPESDDRAAYTIRGAFGDFACSLALKRVKAI